MVIDQGHFSSKGVLGKLYQLIIQWQGEIPFPAKFVFFLFNISPDNSPFPYTRFPANTQKEHNKVTIPPGFQPEVKHSTSKH